MKKLLLLVLLSAAGYAAWRKFFAGDEDLWTEATTNDQVDLR